ncbi:MAG: MATE family efflux transporter [Pelagibacteraceae bacterium]|jgi:MATE family multidrug resistance protein|nr:MATE family efflux transporter [Pelagibacteraceae bacterium]MBT6169152.1 MATE family efflux transporter [Flavobacteriaceae bacterium]MBT6448269.1 MATE family efflux transporter [Flavobacteriaceae bacterium]
MLGMVGHMTVAFADNVMVGQLGAAELAAVSLGNSFFFLAMSLAIGFATAITPIVAEADSSKNIMGVKDALKHGLILCSIMGISLYLLLMLVKPIMFKMNQPLEVVKLAIPYLNFIALSIIPLIIFEALKRFSDGLSNTKYPMYATILANVINITLNYLLIFGHFGFPKLGITGAAIGTLVSRIVMALFLWIIFINKEKFKQYIFNLNFKILDNSIFKKIINLGFPSALQMLFEVGIFTSAIWISGVLGKNFQAANQIAFNLSAMTFMIGVGLNVAAMIRVGNQKGLADFISLRRIAFSIFLLVILIEIVFAFMFFTLRDWLPTLYLDTGNIAKIIENQEVIMIASELLIIVALFQIFDGLQVVILGALRGMQDVKIPTLMTFIAYWLIGFPICYYLGLYTPLKSTGIWIGLLSGLASASVMLYIRFDYLTKKLIAKNNSH